MLTSTLDFGLLFSFCTMCLSSHTLLAINIIYSCWFKNGFAWKKYVSNLHYKFLWAARTWSKCIVFLPCNLDLIIYRVGSKNLGVFLSEPGLTRLLDRIFWYETISNLIFLFTNFRTGCVWVKKKLFVPVWFLWWVKNFGQSPVYILIGWPMITYKWWRGITI